MEWLGFGLIALVWFCWHSYAARQAQKLKDAEKQIADLHYHINRDDI